MCLSPGVRGQTDNTYMVYRGACLKAAAASLMCADGTEEKLNFLWTVLASCTSLSKLSVDLTTEIFSANIVTKRSRCPQGANNVLYGEKGFLCSERLKAHS